MRKTYVALKSVTAKLTITAERLAAILFIAAILGTFTCADEPVIPMLEGTVFQTIAERIHWGNSIAFNLSVGVLGGLLVWFLVSWVPERRRRLLMRRSLGKRYKEFKEDITLTLLMAANGVGDLELRDQLQDYRAFITYFEANNRQLWYDALNGMQGNPDHINEIIVELELLAAEVRYVLESVHFTDDYSHGFFKRLNENIYRLKSSTVYTHDQVKYLGRFLWGILARWNFIHGQRSIDDIEDMIARI